MYIQRHPFTGIIRLLFIAIASLLLSGCGSLITFVTATPNETQQTASAVTALPTDGTTATAETTATRRPRNTATAAPTDSSTTTPTPKAAKATAKPSLTPTAKPTQSTIDGLQTINPRDLPPEARKTLALIDSGGPFPYSRDGVVFQNREGLLPKKNATYYHEYTVVTPGSPDRGAKRLIAGSKGEIYYTEDHYATFVRVIR